MTVFDILPANRIGLGLGADSPAKAIAEIARLMASSPSMLNATLFEKEVLAREELSPTAAGNGIAFPHARSNCVSEIVMAAGRSEAGIVFQEGQPPVRLIFLIGTPNNMVREYLGVVGDLARRVKQQQVRESLLAAPTASAFLDALRSVQKL